MNNLDRVIDRENNSYKEIITDKNGNIVHRCIEPLSEHQGYGSAKFTKKKIARSNKKRL